MFLSRTMTAPTFARVQVERSATWRVMVRKYWCQLGRSLIEVSLRQKAERFGDERQDEYHQGCERGEATAGAERPEVVLGRRVSERQEHGDDDCPDQPSDPAPEPEPDQEGDQHRRHETLPL